MVRARIALVARPKICYTPPSYGLSEKISWTVTMMELPKMMAQKLVNIHMFRKLIARWLLLVGCGVATLWGNSQNIPIGYAAQDFSLLYTGLVMTEEAEILSGPGNKYYVTQTVPRGTRVEVYQQRNDGWCAIRPLPESFTLVASDAVRVDPNDPKKATVLVEATPSYIGSSCSDAKHTIQVKLHQGETVELLSGPSDKQTSDLWLRIVPPAGEFRWIRQDQLRPLPTPLFATSRPNATQTVVANPTNRSANVVADSTANLNSTANPVVNSLEKPSEPTLAVVPQTHQASRIKENPAQPQSPTPNTEPNFAAQSSSNRGVASSPVSAGHTASSPEAARRGDAAVQPTAFTPGSSESVGPPAMLPPPGAAGSAASRGRSTGAMPTEMPANGTSAIPARAMPMENGGGADGFDITGDAASLTPFQNGLLQISDQIGTAISGDPVQWNLSSLQGEVANLSQQARSPEEQQQAQMLTQQLVEYQRIQQEVTQSSQGFNRPAGIDAMGNPQLASMGNGGVGNPYSTYPNGINGNGLGGVENPSVYSGYPNAGYNAYNSTSYTQTAIQAEDNDQSFLGQMRRHLRKLQFWRQPEQPQVQRTFNGNWAMPRYGFTAPSRMGNTTGMNTSTSNMSNGYVNGTYPMGQNRVHYVGSNPYATATDTTALPSAMASAQPVSGWRPRSAMVNLGQNGANSSNGVVFGNRSAVAYVPTISTAAGNTAGAGTSFGSVPPPVPTSVQSP